MRSPATGASPAPTGPAIRSPPSSCRATCSTRARCCAWSMRSKATRRPSAGCASASSSGSTPPRRATTWPSTPRRSGARSRRAAPACRRACSRCSRDLRRGQVSQSDHEHVRGRPQSRRHRGQRRVRERDVPAHRVQAAHRRGARAAAADGAAVHQQVLHPRPAARQLVRAPCRQARPPHLRHELAQSRREPAHRDLGRLRRAGRDTRHRRGARHRRRPTPRRTTRPSSTCSASASAARCCRPRSPCSPRAAASRPTA